MEPRVSNEQIVAMRKSRATISERPEYAWQDGAMDLRDLYEPLVTSRAERIAALEDALRDAVKEMERCKKFCHQAYTICDHNSILALRDVPNNLAITSARALLTPKTTDPK